MKRWIALAALIITIPFVLGNNSGMDLRYVSPAELAVSPDGTRLYVLCERTEELRVLDTATNKSVKEIKVGRVPRGLSLSADGSQIYVANSWSDDVSVIDATKLEVVNTIKAGFEPTSAVAEAKSNTLFVANRISNDISVVDLATGKEKKRLTAGRGASYLAMSPDGSRVFATHVFPNSGEHRKKPQSEITVLDVASQRVETRTALPDVAGMFHIAFSRDGKLGAVAQLRPKNLVPIAHVAHGWVFVNALTIFGDAVGGSLQVPIDELDQYYAMPFGVAITPDHSKVYVSTASADSVTVISTEKLIGFANKRRAPFVNDLSASSNYVTARIPVGNNPRGIALTPDGKKLYVANRLDDSISVIDVATDTVVNTIDLGGPKQINAVRVGERLFNSSKRTFQGQFACANCHIDGSFDGLEWDLAPDGFGKDIVDNRMLEDLTGTEPFKWNGGNPDMPTECGPRTAMFFFRSEGFNTRELTDLVTYVMAQPFRPNRYRLPNGDLTAAQERGKTLYERTVDKTGKPIEEKNQCGYCHSGPKYTNNQRFDVGTGKATDRSAMIDVPQLSNVYLTAPYLHDGSARSLEEIWTVYNPHDQHGRTNDLTKDELNDLIEYLRTL